MRRELSLVDRVAWASAIAAGVAALVSAVVTSTFAAWLLQRAEDRRLYEAAVILAEEAGMVLPDPASVAAVVAHESDETEHAALSFAVVDHAGRVVAGDRRLEPVADGACATGGRGAFRACGVASAHELTAIAASAHATPTPLLVLAATITAVLGGAGAWLASRPISRATVAPLERLRSRLSTLDVDLGGLVDLGPAERVPEVDQLRTTIEQLLERVTLAIDQARRFAANAAHELRTPLSTVRAELELIAEHPAVTPGLREPLARVERKAAELGALVERLLILALPRAPADMGETVSLRDLVEDAIAALSAADRMRVGTSGGDAVMRGDSLLLGILVTNALSNALKFGSLAHLTVLAGDDVAVLHVDDDGPGVPPAERERVFEPFNRTRDALHRRIPGHGLGLALVRHVAELYGGQAAFVERRGRGARLEIRLPIHRGPAEPAEGAPGVASGSGALEGRG